MFPLRLKSNSKQLILQHTCARSTRGVSRCPEIVGITRASQGSSGLRVAMKRTFCAKLASSKRFVEAHFTGWKKMKKIRKVMLHQHYLLYKFNQAMRLDLQLQVTGSVLNLGSCQFRKSLCVSDYSLWVL